MVQILIASNEIGGNNCKMAYTDSEVIKENRLLLCLFVSFAVKRANYNEYTYG